MARKFGQVASDYTPNDNPNVVFIRTFKDPMTQIRICPCTGTNKNGDTVYGADAWVRAREHFAEGVGSFPCNKVNGEECVGCNDPDPEVNIPSGKYYFNALDDQAQLRVYKFGVTLWKIFQGRQQRAFSNDSDNKQPLSDRDYIVIHSGVRKDSTYDPEPGEKYPVEFPEVMHDIEQILADQYTEAEAAYGVSAPKPAAKTGRIGATETPAPAKAPAKAPAAPVDEGIKPGDPDEWAIWGQSPTDVQIDSADTSAIKSWLDSREIEYPSRAPRIRLIEIAKTAADPPF